MHDQQQCQLKLGFFLHWLGFLEILYQPQNPITLVHTVEEYQPRQLELMALSDHHQNSKKDILRIQRKANIMKADIIITTQKDEQKLLLYANQLSIFVLAIEVRFLPEHGKSIKEMLNLYAQTCLPLWYAILYGLENKSEHGKDSLKCNFVLGSTPRSNPS